LVSSKGRRILWVVFDYIVRFADAAGNEHALKYRSHMPLSEGAGIAPGPAWRGPQVLVTEVRQDASRAMVGSIRAKALPQSLAERREGGERRSGSDRRRAKRRITVEQRSGGERRLGERRIFTEPWVRFG
jgi:hypothetical protein